MNKAGAWLWLVIMLVVAAYVGIRALVGLHLESNIFALLPPSHRDASAARVVDHVTTALSRRVLLLVGDRSPAVAAHAADALESDLIRSGMVTPVAQGDAGTELAKVYFAHRAYLLSPGDHDLLLRNQGRTIADRALSIVYGPGGPAKGQLIARDPFLLFPSFLYSIPVSQTHMSIVGGRPVVGDGRLTYALLVFTLRGDPFSISFQSEFVPLVDSAVAKVKSSDHGLDVVRLGAVFYAQASTSESMNETSSLGTVSMLGTLVLILCAFRRFRPLLLGFVSIASGILCGLAVTLVTFGNLHAIALLFGVSLIGISVDYCLQYFSEYFDPGAPSPGLRLKRVLPGVLLGVTTTLIGYITLLLAPFPGLRQVAVFSVAGLSASVLTVALWFPRLDIARPPAPGKALLRLGEEHWALWEQPRYRQARWVLIAVCGFLAVAGMFRLRFDDDVRHLQSLSASLKQQEAKVSTLTGLGGESQFLIVQGHSEQAVLENEERLIPTLTQLQQDGAIRSYEATAQFVPSVHRQMENKQLLQERLLSPYLSSYLRQLGLASVPATIDSGPLLPRMVSHFGPLSLLSVLDASTPGDAAHVVLLGGVSDASRVSAAVAARQGIQQVNPAADWSALFGAYRQYALYLLALSAFLMYPVLAWRYGIAGGARVMMPSLVAAVLSPSLVALLGMPVSFFNTMALVLVLSIGVDYSVFCRETSGERKVVTMAAVFLAAASSILTFGLLSLSSVTAVSAFGMTMLIGIALAFLFAPAAGDARFGPAP